MSLSLSVSMISGNKDGWYSRLSSVRSCTQGCLIEKGWSFEETPRNLFLKFQELGLVLVDCFEDAVFFGLFGFDFCSDLFDGFKAYAGIFVDDVVLLVVANHVDDDLFDCIGYWFHCLSSLEEVSVVYYSISWGSESMGSGQFSWKIAIALFSPVFGRS